MKTIVAGFDGSAHAERALARAAELGEVLGGRLVVVSVGHAARRPAPDPVLADPTLVPVGGLLQGGVLEEAAPAGLGEGEAAQLLDRARGLLGPRGADADYVVEVGDAAERLLHVADERAADLLVVGCPPHGLLDRVLGHCVDERVLRRSHRDVLLVH